MGLFDAIKKTLTGSSGQQSSSGKTGASKGTGSGSSKGKAGQGGGQRSGGSSSSGNRNRNRNRNRSGSGGGGNRQGGQGSQGGTSTKRQGGQGGQGGNRQGGQGSGSSSNNRNRNRNRNRSGSGSAGTGTRKVTRTDVDGTVEQQTNEQGGSQRQGGQRKSGSSSNRSRSGQRSRRGGQRRERARRGSASSGSHRRVLDANERPKEPVKKQILINASDPNEIRVAIREQSKVVEVYVERKGKRSLAGNIYKGRVQNVLPGMEAAFVDIGLERNGFLYVDEVTPAAADSDQKMTVTMATGSEPVDLDATDVTDIVPAKESDDAAPAGDGDGTDVADATTEPATSTASSIELAEVAADESSSEVIDVSATIEEEEREAAGEKQPARSRSRSRGRAQATKKKIQELLRPGQEILVQVVKDPMGTKGSRLTTQYSLAGRYLVYVPDGEGLGVSRRLEDAERERLRGIVKQFELPAGGGLIVRTAAEGAAEEDIARDLQLLLKLHEQLMEKSVDQRAPKLLYNEADLSLRIIRDLFNDEVEGVIVDDERQYQRIVNYLKRTSPTLIERVTLWDGQRPLFETHGVEQAIKSTLSKRVNLPGGGYLIIDYAEAFTVIDVNTGRNVGKTSLEETITKTNMEAAEEIVRQLRLRDIGGIIVVDFIDMNLMKNRDAVLEHFRKELSKDRTKTYLVEISPLGLVEMTRQNVSDGVREILTSSCSHCEGRGVLIAPETHAIEVERAIVELTEGLDASIEAVAIETAPAIHGVLAGSLQKRRELTKRAGKEIRLFADPGLEPNTFALRKQGQASDIDAMEDPLYRGQQFTVKIDKVDPSCESDGIAYLNGVEIIVIGAGSDVGEEKVILLEAVAGSRAFATLVKPPRRRRRRGGRGRRGRGRAEAGAAADGTDETLLDDEELGEDELDGEEFEDDVDDADEDLGDEIPVRDAADDGRILEVDDADEASEIPERFVMLDDDEDAGDDDDDDDDLDEDDDIDDGDDDGDDDDDDDGVDIDDVDGDEDSDEEADDDIAVGHPDIDAAASDVRVSAQPRATVADLPDVELDEDDALLAARGAQVQRSGSSNARARTSSGASSQRSGSGRSGSGSSSSQRNRSRSSSTRSGTARSGNGSATGAQSARSSAKPASAATDAQASGSAEGDSPQAGGANGTGTSSNANRRRRRGSRGGRNRRRPAGQAGSGESTGAGNTAGTSSDAGAATRSSSPTSSSGPAGGEA